MPNHPIFGHINRWDLDGVKQCVLADAAVLDETAGGETPLVYALRRDKPHIALWLIKHRGQHDVDTQDGSGINSLHGACDGGFLSVVKALVAAGADPVLTTDQGSTPLMFASGKGHYDTVSYLLQLPAVKASIDEVSSLNGSAVSLAAQAGKAAVVHLLIEAGADPSIPAGRDSPLAVASRKCHTATASLIKDVLSKKRKRDS